MPKQTRRHPRRRDRRRRTQHRRTQHRRGGLLTPEQRNELLVNSQYAVKDPRGYTLSMFNEFQGISINEEKAKKTFNLLYKRLHREHARIIAELDEIIASHPHNAARFTRPLLYELELLRAAASRNYDGMIHAIPFNKSSKYFAEMTDNRRRLKALLDLIDASLANYAPQIANLSIQRNMSNNFLSGNMSLEGVNQSSLKEPEMVSPEYNMRANFLSGNVEIQ